ncbi:phosphoribosyltransferase family protein [Arthrobacter oryzae]|uniref:ComF family protein n=1 Tax=Arthrobacter oryzae TaxID=409290 RepID=UPI0028634D0F|nr:phosphoribosyltransferase family protein [Arthrobacter oryzae]MDR6506432.1 putative amidophosphoribosyltransferase [Arthrobacter oryzae]
MIRSPDPDLAPPTATPAKHRSEYSQWLPRAADRVLGAGRELLALAAPVECVCCGTEDYSLCGPCDRAVRTLTRTPFRAEGQAPALMDVNGSVILPVVAAGIYREELAQAVLSFKRHGQGQLESVLAKALGRAIREAAGTMQGFCLVPVPTTNSAFRRRGFSPVHLMLRNLARNGGLGAGTLAPVLRKGRAAVQCPWAFADLRERIRALIPAPAMAGGQKGLGRGARVRRVRGSMRAGSALFAPDIRGRPCIIVDDVLTTGATLAEAARAVHQAGGVVAGAVVLAATRPPDSADPIAAPGATARLEA